jgi:signal transduction histidine kinase
MHPAHELLALVVLSLHIALPVGTWAMLAGYRDGPSRIWLAGITCYCFGVMLAGLNSLSYSDSKFITLALFYLASILLMLEALMQDVYNSQRHPRVLVFALIIGGLYFGTIAHLGLFATTGLMSISAMFLVFGFVGIGLTTQLMRRHKSRSMWMITLALILMSSGHFLRLSMLAWGAHPEDFQVAAFTWNSNYLVVTTVLTMILISFGYWGYVLDKMRLINQRDMAQKMAAEILAQESQALIKERDQLLMVNARVSAISSLSSFSAMLVHDISQPLQALELGLYGLQSQIGNDDTLQVKSSIAELQHLSSKAGEMVGHLRQLMGKGQEQVSPVNPDQTMRAILPILQGEAKQRGIQLTYHAELPNTPLVMSNAVILQRIVFNTVGNALDALGSHTDASPAIHIVMHAQHHDQVPGVALLIQDNGSGFEPSVLAQLNTPIQTSKPDGLGLGLMLMQNMVRMWGGHSLIGNRPPSESTGGLIQIWMRSAQDEKSI